MLVTYTSQNAGPVGLSRYSGVVGVSNQTGEIEGSKIRQFFGGAMTNTIEVDPSHRHQLMQVWFRTVLILALGFSGSFLTANAQVTTTINGPVTDASGGVVPKARVTLTNDATKEKRVVPSNGSGFFSYQSLNPGSYSVRIEAPGFSVLEQHGIQLNAGDSKKHSRNGPCCRKRTTNRHGQ